MKKAIGLLFILALFVGFYGIDVTASSCDYEDSYRGQVQTREKNKPVKYAKIKVKSVANFSYAENEKLKTDEQGAFTLCSSDHKDGDYLITARKTGYEQARFLLTIMKDWYTDFTMEMDKIGQAPNDKGEISGIVIEEFYEPYEIWVLIKGTSKTNYNDFTIIYDDQYRFKFKNLKPDVYTLIFDDFDEVGDTGAYYKKVIDLKKNMKCDIIIKHEDFVRYEGVPE